MIEQERIAEVRSQGTPLPGQKNRSSDNVTFTIPAGTLQLRYNVTGSPNAATVTFNVMKDVTLGIDPVIAKDVKSSSVSPVSDYQSGTRYYIANPGNNPGNPPFVVELWAVR